MDFQIKADKVNKGVHSPTVHTTKVTSDNSMILFLLLLLKEILKQFYEGTLLTEKKNIYFF